MLDKVSWQTVATALLPRKGGYCCTSWSSMLAAVLPAHANDLRPVLLLLGSGRRAAHAKFLHKVKCFWRTRARVKLTVRLRWGSLGGGTQLSSGESGKPTERAVRSNYERISQLGKPATFHTKARFRALLFQGCWSRLRDRKGLCKPAASLWLWNHTPSKQNVS